MPGRPRAHSPYFALAVSEIRGFDLGDDNELRDELARKREADPDALEGDDWLLLGVLTHRLAEREEPGSSDAYAAICFARAAALDHRAGLAHYLRGEVLLLLGRLDDADEAFTRAAEHPDEDACPSAELIHARGRIAEAKGQPQRALGFFLEGLELDAASASRWTDTARVLVELDQPEEAGNALARALANDPGNLDARIERAALAATQQQTSDVVSNLAQALELDPDVRSWALLDPRFDRVRSEPSFAALLADPPPPDLGWLDALPSWVRALQHSSAGSQLRWLGGDESEALAAEIARAHHRAPPGVMYSEITLARARDLLRNKRPVAYGPASTTLDRRAERAIVWIDAQRPDTLWLALSRHYPPFLWLRAGTSMSALQAALEEFFPRPSLQRVDLTRTARGFLGYRLRFGIPDPGTGRIEPANARELDRHFMVSPFVDSAYWGSAYDEDPWPDEIPPQPGELLKMSARQRRVAEQAPGRVWSISRRTRHSRSILTIELHHRDVFVAEVRYRPSRDHTVVKRLNADLGCDYPTDMPVDAVAALLGLQFEQSTDLQGRLDATADPEEIAGLLLVLSALRHSDLCMTRIHRRYMDHPDSVVRTTLCNIFVAHNHESLLEEMSVLESDDEIREQIESVLDEGIGIVQYDPYTDYDESDIDYGNDDGLEVALALATEDA